jgi:hypothetical protein
MWTTVALTVCTEMLFLMAAQFGQQNFPHDITKPQPGNPTSLMMILER